MPSKINTFPEYVLKDPETYLLKTDDTASPEKIKGLKNPENFIKTDTRPLDFIPPLPKELFLGPLPYPTIVNEKLENPKAGLFGCTRTNKDGSKKAHGGIDLFAPVGTPVRASEEGIMTRKKDRNGYGKYITIQHRNGYETLYGHLSNNSVLKNGTYVEKGALIGYSGKTGNAKDPDIISHLHFEVRQAGHIERSEEEEQCTIKHAAINPLPLISESKHKFDESLQIKAQFRQVLKANWGI